MTMTHKGRGNSNKIRVPTPVPHCRQSRPTSQFKRHTFSFRVISATFVPWLPTDWSPCTTKTHKTATKRRCFLYHAHSRRGNKGSDAPCQNAGTSRFKPTAHRPGPSSRRVQLRARCCQQSQTEGPSPCDDGLPPSPLPTREQSSWSEKGREKRESSLIQPPPPSAVGLLPAPHHTTEGGKRAPPRRPSLLDGGRGHTQTHAAS